MLVPNNRLWTYEKKNAVQIITKPMNVYAHFTTSRVKQPIFIPENW